MLFNSFEFLIFFPLVTALYFLLPHRARWGMLLIASCIFYMAFIPRYILVLFVTILIDYLAAIKIEESRDPSARKMWLVVSIVSTCMVLFVFKYFNFFNANLEVIASFFHLHYPVETLRVILPIGLSFHTFQSLSYVIEVYYKRQSAARHLGIYSLYVMFYPQLVAGPIERPQNLLHQFTEKHHFDYRRVTDGLKLMAWGMFKKVVIADRLALVVNQVYGAPTEYTGLALILATVCFSFQIYCDFSGYSDIAIGAAQVMGFRLSLNFNRPYFSKSIGEFWRRWHMSLSGWFRDYVYIPLGGNRVNRPRLFFNLLVTFTLSGLWHGANWTYITWGALNGVYLVLALTTRDARDRLADWIGLSNFPSFHNLLRVLTTFILVSFAWIFFRARDMTEALYIVTHAFAGLSLANLLPIRQLGASPLELTIAGCAVGFLICVQLMQRHQHIRQLLTSIPWWWRWSLYYVMVLFIVFCGVFRRAEFIYFQF